MKKIRRTIVLLLAMAVALTACGTQTVEAYENIRISGGFTATVREVMPDYCFDNVTPAVAVVTEFQSGPFIVNLGPELASELVAGETYVFEIESKEIQVPAGTESYISNTVVLLNQYNLQVVGYRVAEDDELGLESLTLSVEKME